MNDRDPFTDPSDHIDRALSSAFGSRHVPPMSQPSMIDVRHRARRRQQRRTAGMVAAIVLVGASGVGVYALRHDGGRAALSPGDTVGDGAPSTTVACLGMSTTTVTALLVPSTTLPPGTYTIQQGDTPAMVAQKFDLTVEELNAANAGLAGYDAFIVGLAITIPGAGPVAVFLPDLSGVTLPPKAGGCGPGVQWTWRCTGDLGVDEFGRQVFESCEQVEPGVTTIPGMVVPTTSPPTTYPGQPIGTTTTYPPDTTAVVSVNGNTDATTTTNVVYPATTEPPTTTIQG